MSSLFYLLRKTLKNLIKGAFKKPIVLIGYIVAAIFVIGMLVVSFIMPAGALRTASPKLFTGIMMLVFVFLYYTTLKLGIEKGSTYFRMADVNLLFTAPLKPNNVLLYGFIKQIGGTLLMVMLVSFQIPNLKNNFAMQPYAVPLLFLSIALYALSYPLISMVIYSWASKKKARKKLLKRVFDACAIIIAVIFLISLSQTRDFTTSLDTVLNNPIAKYFPIIGWTGSVASSAMIGFTTEFWVGLSGMLVLIIGSSIALYRMNLDYYEDVLEGTEYIEAALKAKREGNNMNFNVKIKDKVKQKLTGNGASAIFSKHMLEIRRTSFFLFFDRASVSVIIASIAFKFIMPDKSGKMGILLVLFFSVYMLFLFQMQGKLGAELDKHYIFLIPATSSQKLLYVTLAEHLKNLIDGTILFSIAGILFSASIPIILACIATYVSFGAVFVYIDVLGKKLFGWVHSKGMMIFMKLIFSLLIILPGIIAMIVVGMSIKNEMLMIIAFGGWSLVLAITTFIFSMGILNNLESAG